MKVIKISIVIPLYNEEEVLATLITRLDKIATTLEFPIEIVFVDDGSSDNTSTLIEGIALKDEKYKAVILSRNYGHQIAVSAGMACVSASDAVMIIDGDLQDPPEMIQEFYNQIQNGYDVVYAVRKKRKEGWIKKLAYWSFYRLLKRLSEVAIPLDSGDFCMVTRQVNDILVTMPEQSRFLRGMRTWVGFNQIGIEYERDMRAVGKSKYTFKRLLKLAYDGIFNFSNVPLKLISRLGFYAFLVSSVYLFYVLVKKMLGYSMPSGFTTLILAIILFSGVQLICLGVIGEYQARIYLQVKGRPLFLIKRKVIDKKIANG